jgi:hypothetical protein
MRNIILVGFLVVFFLANNGFAQSPEPMLIKTDGSCVSFSDRDIGKHNDRGDGLHVVFQDSLRTKILRTYYLKDGKLNGLVQLFNGEGRLLEVTNYQKGFENGYSYKWNNAGILIRKEYWESGIIKKKWVYAK